MDKQQQERPLTALQMMSLGFKEHQEKQEQLNREYLLKQGYTVEQLDAEDDEGAGMTVNVDELAKQEREKERAEAFQKEVKVNSAKSNEKSKGIKLDHVIK